MQVRVSPLVPLGRIVACAAMISALAGTAAAQTASPTPAATAPPGMTTMPPATPTPPPTASPPPGLTAHAHGNVTLTMRAQTISVDAQIGMAQRDGRTRVDVQSAPNSGPPGMPAIGMTVLVDPAARTVTLWNDAKKIYAVQKIDIGRVVSGSSPSPRPRPSTRPTPKPSSAPMRAPRVGMPQGSFLRNLDVLSFTVKLTGHGTTAGVPTSGLALDFQIAGRAKRETAHLAVTTQLADDYLFFPMTLDATVDPGTPQFGAHLTYVVDSLVRGLPPASQFVVPAGYARATSIFEVIFSPRSGPPSSPPPR